MTQETLTWDWEVGFPNWVRKTELVARYRRHCSPPGGGGWLGRDQPPPHTTKAVEQGPGRDRGVRVGDGGGRR